MGTTQISTYRRPSLLGRTVIDDIFGDIFTNDFSNYLRQSTQGYPVVDIYRDEAGSTIMEFALAGFSKEELSVDILPEKRCITVAANSNSQASDGRRIARRSFQKTFVNYDNNLNLGSASAKFENGLLTITVPQRPEAKPISIDIK
jgi:HSP20 family protein